MLYRAVGVLSLAIWLCMAAAELCAPLHAWLHGGTIPKDDDDCAIVCIAHGKIDTETAAAPDAMPVPWIEAAPRIESSVKSRPLHSFRTAAARLSSLPFPNCWFQGLPVASPGKLLT